MPVEIRFPYGTKCRAALLRRKKVRIATPVCALARNDVVFLFLPIKVDKKSRVHFRHPGSFLRQLLR